jgi:chromosome partitioning protein
MVISVATQKGGSGKTTTAISLAAGLARKGKKTLLVDIDSQANSSKVLFEDYPKLTDDQTIVRTILRHDGTPSTLPVLPTTIPQLSIVPSHILLSGTDFELTSAIDHREARLKNELDKIKDDYYAVIIDCPPALSWLTINAFTASDKVIIVVSPGYFELDSIVQISKTINEVREFFNPTLTVAGFLFTMSDPTINSETSLKLLRQTYTGQVLTTIIPRNVDIRDAHFNKQDIFAFNKHAKAALAYERLIAELFKL